MLKRSFGRTACFQTITRMVWVSFPVLAAIALSPARANAQTCPAVGADTDCGTIITITDTGATVSFTGQGPYDGIEDTLVGVVNKSSRPVTSLDLTSSLQIFGFEGDGIVAYGIPGNPQDSSGYGGPNAYFSNINPALTSGRVNFITPIAAKTGTAYFSLEEAISASTACTSIINKALSGPIVAGTQITATFTPKSGYTQSQAAQLCGFKAFDWQQKLTSLPLPSPFFQVGNPPKNLSAPPAFFDPPPGGYTYQADNSYPFYYDPDNGELQSQISGNTLSFGDAPADNCLPGGSGSSCSGKTAPKGSKLAFTTRLVGVNANRTATDLGIGFKWTSTFNGTSGGVSRTKNSLPTDPGSGTGGVTVIDVQTDSNFGLSVTGVNGGAPTSPPSLSSGTACNGTFSGTFNGNVTVSTGQTCTFVDGMIVGNVQVNGGQLVLSGSRVQGNVQVSRNSPFTIGPSVAIDQNLQISGEESGSTPAGTTPNQVCDAIVYGNLSLEKINANVQIGSASPSTCAGNVIGGNLTVEENKGSTAIYNNTVSGNLTVEENKGSTQVFSNTVVKTLSCDDNTSISGGSNTAPKKVDQCSKF